MAATHPGPVYVWSADVDGQLLWNADLLLTFNQGSSLKVHQMVVFMASPVLRELYGPTKDEPTRMILARNEENVLMLPLMDDSLDGWRLLLQFIYPGPKIDMDRLFPQFDVLYHLAHKYNIQRVLEECMHYLKHGMRYDMDPASDRFLLRWTDFAARYNDQELLQLLTLKLSNLLRTGVSSLPRRSDLVWNTIHGGLVMSVLAQELNRTRGKLAHIEKGLKEAELRVLNAPHPCAGNHHQLVYTEHEFQQLEDIQDNAIPDDYYYGEEASWVYREEDYD